MNREKSLTWWRGLRFEEQKNLSNKHFPKLDFFLVFMSSSRIEQIWEKENLQK
jgi:hypothetical protein